MEKPGLTQDFRVVESRYPGCLQPVPLAHPWPPCSLLQCSKCWGSQEAEMLMASWAPRGPRQLLARPRCQGCEPASSWWPHKPCYAWLWAPGLCHMLTNTPSLRKAGNLMLLVQNRSLHTILPFYVGIFSTDANTYIFPGTITIPILWKFRCFLPTVCKLEICVFHMRFNV